MTRVLAPKARKAAPATDPSTPLGNTPGHVQHFTGRGFVRTIAEHFEVELVRRPVPWTLVRARVR